LSTLPHFLDNRFIDGVEVVSLTYRPTSASEEVSWYSFVLKFDLSGKEKQRNRNLSDECLQYVTTLLLVCSTFMLPFASYIFQRHLVFLFTFPYARCICLILHLIQPLSLSIDLGRFPRSPSASYRMNMETTAADSNF
jgi:hypothetical protein